MANITNGHTLQAGLSQSSRLFQPIKIGNMHLQHRIAMCPMTRCRVDDDYVPRPEVKEYYKQRACVPGTLIITEGVVFAKNMVGGFPSPGIWSQAQIAAWKEITDEVHRQGSFIVAQLFAFGRTAAEANLQKEGLDLIGPSAIPMEQGASTPRAMTIREIDQAVKDSATAALNAIQAGFDGVECHGANGYLGDQFLREVSNQRDDAYGGSIEKRSRFIEDIMKAMVDAVGADRVGLRLSPYSTFQGMHLPDPIPQHEDVIRRAKKLNLMYLSMVEGRISGSEDMAFAGTLDFAYKLWDGPLLVAGGYTPDKALDLVDKERAGRDMVVMFGRPFTSNPDLVHRVRRGLPLTKYDRSTFYTPTAEGYTDFPASKDFNESVEARG